MWKWKRKPIREVVSLIATRPDEVLLSSKDGGKNWHFPQEEVRRDKDGQPTETVLEALDRMVKKLHGIEEEDVFGEGSGLFQSHNDEETIYYIYSTQSKPS